jgi:hypothetical protein
MKSSSFHDTKVFNKQQKYSLVERRNEIGLIGRRGQAPLEVVGVVTEAAGRARLPLHELLRQPIAGDLAQHLRTQTRPKNISSRQPA